MYDLFDDVRAQIGENAVVLWDRDVIHLPSSPPKWCDARVFMRAQMWRAYVDTVDDDDECFFSVFSGGRMFVIWCVDHWLVRRLGDPTSVNSPLNERLEHFVWRAYRIVRRRVGGAASGA